MWSYETIAITYHSYNPSYDNLLNLIKKDEQINKYLSFSQTDSKFIFINHDFVGFCKIFPVDDENLEYEIEIAIIEQYRGKGLASIILEDLTKHLFLGPNICQTVQLSIDKSNSSSIRMATKNGFILDEVKTKDLRKYGDTNTLIFSKENFILNNDYQNGITKAAS